MPTDTEELICVRCGLEVRVNRESYEIFERMHWVCFHFEFEHGGFDPDEECDAPGCASVHLAPSPHRGGTAHRPPRQRRHRAPGVKLGSRSVAWRLTRTRVRERLPALGDGIENFHCENFAFALDGTRTRRSIRLPWAMGITNQGSSSPSEASKIGMMCGRLNWRWTSISRSILSRASGTKLRGRLNATNCPGRSRCSTRNTSA